jgi:hypothetical protein
MIAGEQGAAKDKKNSAALGFSYQGNRSLDEVAAGNEALRLLKSTSFPYLSEGRYLFQG